jgi:amino acid adenylation domain-containing protein
LIEEQAELRPDAVAVVCGEDSVTYGELNARANQLAHFLRQLGRERQTKIGVLLGRSPDMISTLLGILKAGGIYVPLDIAFPPSRIKDILGPLMVEYLVIHREYMWLMKELSEALPSLKYVLLPDLSQTPPSEATAEDSSELKCVEFFEPKRQPTWNPQNVSSAHDLGYIIFTSGSTGSPKGVMVNHNSVVNLFEWIGKEFSVGPRDELLFVTSICFDLSVYDVFGILSSGGRIRIAGETDISEPQRLLDLLCGSVTFWDSAPALLQQISHFFPSEGSLDCRSLRLVFLSGDWIPVSLPDSVRSQFTQAQVVALGGATEATVWSNFYRVQNVDASWSSIPYGRPIQNARYYVLDSQLNPCPVGIPGDLYIGDECLFVGYANDAALTAAKLLPDPFCRPGGGRIYCTGDRARFWVDGNIEFLGRVDSQVKIRGYRIELGEVESHLNQCAGVGRSVAAIRQDGTGNAQLVAYYVPKIGHAPQPDELQKSLKKSLPEYMVPWCLVKLEEIPLTSNGKVDRKRLPAPPDGSSGETPAFAEPGTRIEQMLMEIWREVLGMDRVSVQSSFFDLGGHSLLATKLVARIKEVFQVPLPLRKLFEFPSIAGLASQLEAALVEEVAQLDEDEVRRLV